MAAPLRHGAAPHHKPRDYSQTPLNVYWEVTQACALACRHCRAEAVPHHHPLELTKDEGFALLRQIAGFGDPKPYLILTGGDPLERSDLYELIDEARRLGVGVSITPAATEALTRDVLAKLKDHGVEGLGLSLDGSTPEKLTTKKWPAKGPRVLWRAKTPNGFSSSASFCLSVITRVTPGKRETACGSRVA